jgi:hypothetical protein
MEKIIQKDKYISLQREMAQIIASHAPDFALLGGTALSWFYLKHRMSYDLDFFAARFDPTAVGQAIRALEGEEFSLTKTVDEQGPRFASHIQYRFDTGFEPGLDYIKLDFVEDRHGLREVTTLDGLSVYTLPAIYYRKILIGCGGSETEDSTGRAVGGDRQVARDLVDLYHLSTRVEPLSKFFRKMTDQKRLPEDAIERFFSWLRRFPRQEFIMEYLAMDLAQAIDPKRVLAHLDEEADALVEDRIGEI